MGEPLMHEYRSPGEKLGEFVYMIYDRILGQYIALNRYSRKPRKYGTRSAAANSIKRGWREGLEIHKFRLERVEE